MLDVTLAYSIRHRWLVLFLTIGAALVGVHSLRRLPIDAVPDVSNVQVEVNTRAPALAPLEVEQRITFPIETELAGIPAVEQVRSLSRYGLSQVTLVFADGTDIYFARQLVGERLAQVRESLPPGSQEPRLGPVATGLGEIFLWTVEALPGARRPDGHPYDLIDLRTIQDWIIKRRLRNVPGVNEVNSIGGFEKQYVVCPDPGEMIAHDVSFRGILDALAANNASVGGGYVEHEGEQYLVRSTGLVGGLDDIANVVVSTRSGIPIRIRDVAQARIGAELRTGAASKDGRETVIGTAIMLLGANSRAVAQKVGETLAGIGRSLPEGVVARPVYDRTQLVDATLDTVRKNLEEAALLVAAVLVLMLWNVRAAFLVATAIPLSMLLAISGMVHFGISGTLMSLGAIDFGLLVDGAVVLIENVLRRMAVRARALGRPLGADERLAEVLEASREIARPTVFGVAIIMIVYIPILTLTGIEGKMFRPMAQVVILALCAALVLCFTWIPALAALLVGEGARGRPSLPVRWALAVYEPALRWSMRRGWIVIGLSCLLLALAGWRATRLGGEFAPRLGEGAISIEATTAPSVSIPTSLKMQERIQRTLLDQFPDEVSTVFARTGTAEIATDPMGPNSSDVYIMLKNPDAWKRATTQEDLTAKIIDALRDQPGINLEFSQPIEQRVNELNSGVRTDLAVKVFGDDLDRLREIAHRIADLLRSSPGTQGVRVEQVEGLEVLTIDVDRKAIERYGLTVADVQNVVETAVAGKAAGLVLEGDRRFDLVVRLPERLRHDIEAIKSLPVPLPESAETKEEGRLQSTVGDLSAGHAAQPAFVPLGSLARIALEEQPDQISRENGRRRVVVLANVRGRDIAGFVARSQALIDREIQLPEGYWIAWGGQFEHLIAARERLMIAVPLALALIFVLLFAALDSVAQAALVFSGVPLALTGGVLALAWRGIPLSISAGVGFIALSGVAVLNGLVMVSFIDRLRQDGRPLEEAIREGSCDRLRPVLTTALVASLGFIPMALATGPGAEVQRPLATVVIGGLISSTLLTLVLLPTLYRLSQPSVMPENWGRTIPEQAECESLDRSE